MMEFINSQKYCLNNHTPFSLSKD